MSTSTNSMNKITSTSTSRSGKKSSKKAPAVTDAKTEMVVSTPAEVVEKTIEVPADMTPLQNVEVLAATPVTHADSTESSSEEVKAEPKPVVNIWELRKQARAAEEALKKANEAIEKIAETTEKKSAPKTKVVSQPVESVDDSADGFTKVVTKKKPFGKPAAKQSKPDHSDAKPAAEPKPAYKPKQSKPVSSESKPAYKSKQLSDEEVVKRERKNTALLQAQNQLIDECVGQLNPKTRDDINNSLPYVLNFRRTLVVKFDSDFVVADVDGEKFEFSRTRFFENRIFQDKVRERFESLIPPAWIRFFPGRDENTYCMGIMKRRNEE